MFQNFNMRSRSEEIYAASCQLMPGGVNSPVRSFKHLAMTPMLTASAKGSRLFDCDGNSYIDFCNSWGALILGHCHPQVAAAACEQIVLGSSYGTATLHELQLAQRIAEHMPHLEKMRFVSSGTEAAMSAIRLARGFTGRDLIVKFDGNYHGHSDSLLVRAGSGVIAMNTQASSKGVPEDFVAHTASLAYNESQALRSFFQRQGGKVAAVIIEPIAANMGIVPAEREFLLTVREETKKAGALLIVDEVVTGFRIGLGGATEWYGIEPDLACLGKIIGGGFPAALFGGKKEIMDHLAPLGEIYQAGTLSGNPVAMRAGFAALTALEEPGFYAKLEGKTKALLEPVRAVIAQKGLKACIQAVGSAFTLFFGVDRVRNWEDAKAIDTHLFQKMFQYLFDRGIYFSPSAYEAHFLSSAHTEEEIAKTSDALCAFVNAL